MPKRILVVDDDTEIVNAIRILLETESYSVHTAHNWKECVDCLSVEDIDLILLDIMMPGINGRQVRRLIRVAKKWEKIPIIYVTVLELTAKERKEMKKAHKMDDYIKKPFKNDELLAKVKAILK